MIKLFIGMFILAIILSILVPTDGDEKLRERAIEGE